MSVTWAQNYFGIYNNDILFTTGALDTAAGWSVYGAESRLVSGKVKRVLDGYGSAKIKIPSVNKYASEIGLGDIIAIFRGDLKFEYSSSGYFFYPSSGSKVIFFGYVSSVERDVYGNLEISMSELIEELERFSFTITEYLSFTNLNGGVVYLDNKLYKSAYFRNLQEIGIICTDTSLTYKVPDDAVTGMELLEALREAASKVSENGNYHFYLYTTWSKRATYGSTFSFTNRIYVKPESSLVVCGQTVELGSNIVDIDITDDEPDATVIHAIGYDADDNLLTFTGYNGLTSAVACESMASKILLWEDVDFGSGFESASALQTTAQQYIDTNGTGTRSYQIDALDIHGTDSNIEPFAIERRVRVYSEKHEIDDTLPLSELTIDLCNPLKTSISVGASRPRITR